jgi:HK97 family phage portal protein
MTLAQWFVNLLTRARPRSPIRGTSAAAGMFVDDFTALNYSGVFGCVRVISQAIASLDWQVIRESPDGKKERVTGGAVDRILNYAANPEMSAFTWRETGLAHCLLPGNHYSEIERDAMGRPLNVWPIDPHRMFVTRGETGELVYRVSDWAGGTRELAARDVLHVKGLCWDGILGMSPVGMARRSVGVGLAMDEYAASFYQNGTQLGLVLEHPKNLSEPAQQRLKDSLKQRTGPLQAFRTIVTEEGMKLSRATMTMLDAQFLESRKFGLAEIARWYGVPLHKLAELDRSTNNNIEHQSIEFVQDCILPWCRRLEQEVDIKLFGLRSGKIYTRLNIDTLLRGDIASRYEAYSLGRNGGWLSANDIRKLENMDPIADGDVYLVPLNMVPAEDAGEQLEAAPAEPATDDPKQPDNVIRREAVEWMRNERARNG